MAYKKFRKMKVYEQSGYHYKSTPAIMLKGQWLKELGFEIGDRSDVLGVIEQLRPEDMARVDAALSFSLGLEAQYG